MRTRHTFKPILDDALEVREVPTAAVYSGSLSFLNPPTSSTPTTVKLNSAVVSPSFVVRGTNPPVTHNYPVGIITPYTSASSMNVATPAPVYGGSLSFLNPPSAPTTGTVKLNR